MTCHMASSPYSHFSDFQIERIHVIFVDMTCQSHGHPQSTHMRQIPWTTRQIFIRFTLALGGRLTTNNNKPQTKKNFPFNQKSDIRGAQ